MVLDGLNRPTRSLRVDELDRLARAFADVGVDRVRLTGGEPVRRRGASDEKLRARLESVWRARTDRGAGLRLTSDRRTPFVPVGALKIDSHREIHTRGG